MTEISDTRVTADSIGVFEALSNTRRRLTIQLLHETEVSTLGELATWIAAIENGIPRSEVTGKQRTRVHIALYQIHLPKLHTGGFIAYDEDRGMVAADPWTAGLLSHVRGLQELDETREYDAAETRGSGRNLFVRAVSGVLSR